MLCIGGDRMQAATTSPSPWLLALRYWWEPGKVYAGLRSRTTWFPAYLLTAILMAAGTLIAYPTIRATTQDALSQAELAEGFINLIVTSATVGLALAPFISPLIAAVVVTYALLVLSIFMNARVRFGQLFTLTMWSLLPFQGLRYLVQGVVVSLTRAPAIAAVDLSAAALLPSSLPPLAYAVVAQIDPFYLWSLGLLTLGYATMFHRTTREALVVVSIVLALRIFLTFLMVRATV